MDMVKSLFQDLDIQYGRNEFKIVCCRGIVSLLRSVSVGAVIIDQPTHFLSR